MKNNVDEKQFGTKEAIKVISPLNASRKQLVSEGFKIVKLILLGGCSSDIASSYFFRPSKVTEHVTSRVSMGEFKTK